jgi:hypothetical protein
VKSPIEITYSGTEALSRRTKIRWEEIHHH